MNETMLLAADSFAPIEEVLPSPVEERKDTLDGVHDGIASGGLHAADAVHAVETRTKTCPVCAAQVFADMDTCYNCMYAFGSNEPLEERAAERTGCEEDVRQGFCFPRERPEPSLPMQDAAERRGDELLAEVLVELHRFLGQFLLDRGIDIKEL